MDIRRKLSGGYKVAAAAAGHRNESPYRASRLSSVYHTKGDKPTPIFCSDGRRHVCAGVLQPNGTFRKTVRREHLLQKPPAIAIQKSVLNQLFSLGCRMVEVVLASTGQRLRAPLERFTTRGFSLNRGYGEQRALPLSQWEDAENPQEVLDYEP